MLVNPWMRKVILLNQAAVLSIAALVFASAVRADHQQSDVSSLNSKLQGLDQFLVRYSRIGKSLSLDSTEGVSDDADLLSALARKVENKELSTQLAREAQTLRTKVGASNHPGSISAARDSYMALSETLSHYLTKKN